MQSENPKQKISINYDGVQGDFQIPFDIKTTPQKLSSYFSLNLNTIESIFLHSEKETLPLTSKNLVNGRVYDLGLKYRNIDNRVQKNGIPEENPSMQDNEYFDGYSHLGIHRTMLQDKSRTEAYKKGIEESGYFMEGKTVLDVGTGTGILSIFSAKAGAKKVFAVDASSIINEAKLVISENHLDDKIQTFHSKMEDLILPTEKVDVIVSEWMGSMLVFESMLLSVIEARNRYLTPDGIMLPSFCEMFLCPLDVTDYISEHVGCWKDVYGVDMSVLSDKARNEFFSSAIFTRTIEEKEMLSEGMPFYSFETKYIQESDLEHIIGNFGFELEKEGTLHGFGCWFDVRFIKEVLSTGPKSPETHWKQVMFLFDDYPKVKKGTVVNGIISVMRSAAWGRHYETTIKYWLEGEKGFYQKRFPLV